MATYTQYYSLDKYEGTDRPNLRDQYNSAMDKVDNTLHTFAGNISSAATAAQAAATAAATADAKAVEAYNVGHGADIQAGAALSQAQAAQGDATQALSDLNGKTIITIGESDFSTWFTIPSGTWIDTTKAYSFIAVGAHDKATGNITLTIQGSCFTKAITTSDFDQFKPLVSFRNHKSRAATFLQSVSMPYAQHDTAVELPRYDSTGESPDTLYACIYAGSGAVAISGGVRIAFCMTCDLSPKSV